MFKRLLSSPSFGAGWSLAAFFAMIMFAIGSELWLVYTFLAALFFGFAVLHIWLIKKEDEFVEEVWKWINRQIEDDK